MVIVGESDLNISSPQFELKEKKKEAQHGETQVLCKRPLRISAVTSLMRESWTSPRLLGIWEAWGDVSRGGRKGCSLLAAMPGLFR